MSEGSAKDEKDLKFPNGGNRQQQRGRDNSNSISQPFRNMDYDPMEQPHAPRRGTTDSSAGVGEQNANEWDQEQKITGSDVTLAMTDASTLSQHDPYEKDAKGISLDTAKVPTSLNINERLTGGENNTNGIDADATAMKMEREPRFDQNDNNADAVAVIGDDEFSLDLSLPRLERAPERTATTPINAELLQPIQRLVKVQPEAGCSLPGAYSAGQSRPFPNDPANADDYTYTISEDLQVQATNGMSDLPSSSGDEYLLPPEPLLQTAAASAGTFTAASLGCVDERSAHTSLHVEESSASPGSGYLKPSCRTQWFIGACIIVLALAVGIGTGVGLSMSGNKTETSPSPPSCSLDTVLDECSGSSLSSFQSEIPSCLVERYEAFRKTFTSTFRIAAPDEKSCSPENLALLSSSLHTTHDTSDTILSDRFGLSVFYFATGSDTALRAEGWTSELPHCDWGLRLGQIQCKSTGNAGHVTGIWLNARGLKGYLPSNLPLFLPYLETLDLTDNLLSGSLPTALSKILYLAVNRNLLTGTISSAFTESTTLIEFIVSDNAELRLSRDQPFFSGTQLRALDLAGVNFPTGTVPTELLLLTNLVELNLGRMELTGTIPLELFDLTKLQTLEMQTNRLTGTLPTNLRAMLNLEVLELGFNSFNGTIPSEVGELQSIMTLYLEFNSFVGTIPSELGRLTRLSFLSLYSKELTGQMPMEMSQLTTIQNLLFGKNNLSGTLPEELCALKLQGTMILFGSTYDSADLDLGGLSCLDSNPECCSPIPL